jgi:hypothetical protein
MSNKRRKSIGTAKIKRNRTMRVIRGALKAGTPLPGESRVYMDDNYHLADSYRERGQRLRDEVGELYESGRLSRVKVAG